MMNNTENQLRFFADLSQRCSKKLSFKVHFLLILFAPLLVLGQTNDQNWVKEIRYKIPTVANLISPTADQVQIDLTYVDGLGRVAEKVAHRQSASGKDVITYFEYDQYGRQAKKYLPYATTDMTMQFDSDNSNTLNYISYQNQSPFSESHFEDSPLNRVLKQAAPGNGSNWATTASHSIKFGYMLNDYTNDQVRAFSASATWDRIYYPFLTSLVEEPTRYASDKLFKSEVTDENDIPTLEFKNLKGQLLLKRAFQGTNKIDTYYVYDQYGNLTYVIPPNTSAGGVFDQTVLDNQCYQYQYDDKNRLVAKKLPGKTTEYIVYDGFNRVAATGPAFNPFGNNLDPSEVGWLVTYYDNLGRVAITGWFASAVDNDMRSFLQKERETNLQLINRSSNLSTIDGFEVNYENPSFLPSAFKILSVNYYDDYSFPNAPTNFNLPHIYFNNTSEKPKGLLTGSWVRTLQDVTAATTGDLTTMMYDYRGNVAKTFKKSSMAGGYTNTDNILNFIGQSTTVKIHHLRSDNVNDIPVTTTDDYEYTDESRLKKHTHDINNSGTPELLALNVYDELGKLVGKSVGNNQLSPYQNVRYAYNIRGWLTDINNTAELNTSFFAFKINYDQTENHDGSGSSQSVPNYNGNISETYWRSSSDNILRKYRYDYDELNRMVNAIYYKPNSTVPLTNSYNEVVSYDLNGNIQSLNRNGNLDNNDYSVPIDQLNYIYSTDKKDRLLTVYDDSGNPNGFNDNNGALDYDYDDLGNMIMDQNKGIVSISYNHLNLPTQILFNQGVKKINYIYNATGQKTRKIVTTSTGATITTDYLDGFQYREGKLQFFPTAEGYVNATRIENGYQYNYVFNYLDHLGNVRLSYGKDPKTGVLKILEQNHYYPFGLKHTNYSSALNKFVLEGESISLKQPLYTDGEEGLMNKYKFNGMEYQDELGLNLYDMDYRDYDPAIGRWLGIDPVTHFDQSPYMAMNGDPVYWADPMGDDGLPPEAINTWHHAGSGSMFSGAGNLASGDHFFGGSGDAFWGGETAFTGGELSWNNYNIANGVQTFYGKQAREVFSYLASVRGWSSYIYFDTEYKQNGVKFYRDKKPSYLDSYFADCFNGVNSGEFGPSSMYDATGFSFNFHLSTGFMGEFNLNAGFAVNRTNEIAFFGGYGGNLGYNGSNGAASIGFGINYDIHSNYGDNNDVLKGLGGDNKTYFTGLGVGGASYSNSAKSTKEGWVDDKSGVSTVGLGLNIGFGFGTGVSRGGIWRPFKK